MRITADIRRRPLADPAELPLFASAAESIENTDDIRSVILDLLSHTPTPIDEIIRHAKSEAGPVLAVLLELELGGMAERHPGNRVSLL